MPDSPLIGYSFDDRIGRYRSGQTGRFVARDRILDLLDAQTTGAEQRMRDLTTGAHNGTIAVAVWLELMRTELQRLHLQQGAIAAGGWDRLTLDETSRIQMALDEQYRYLANFGAEMQDTERKPTLPQALSRMAAYIGAARVMFWAIERNRRKPSAPDMTVIEKRELDETALHCPECLMHAQRGYQLLGNLPAPGEQCTCRHKCRCRLKQIEVPTDELGEWIGTYR